MSFWNTDKLKDAGVDIFGASFVPDRIKLGAYELSVDREYYHTEMEGGKESASKGAQIAIPPGQLAVLITQETVKIPADTIGLLSMKFRHKIRGLVNVSGFHVDPGFSGKLIFSVYNAGSKVAHFDPGEAVFLIWLCDMSGQLASYNGEHKNQSGISSDIVNQVHGEIASPGQLKTDIDELAGKLDAIKVVGVVVLSAALGPWFVFWINTGFSKPAPPGMATVQITTLEAILVGLVAGVVLAFVLYSFWAIARTIVQCVAKRITRCFRGR